MDGICKLCSHVSIQIVATPEYKQYVVVGTCKLCTHVSMQITFSSKYIQSGCKGRSLPDLVVK